MVMKTGHIPLLVACAAAAALILPARPAQAQFNRLPGMEFEGLGRLVEFVVNSPVEDPIDQGYEVVTQIGFVPDDSPTPVRVRPADKPYQIAVKDAEKDEDEDDALKPGARVWFKGTIKVNVLHIEDLVVFPLENLSDIPDHWPIETEDKRDRVPMRYSTPTIELSKVAAWVNRMPAVGGGEGENAGPSRHLVMSLQVKNPSREDVKVTLNRVFLAQRANTEGTHIASERISLADDTGRETGKHATTVKAKSEMEVSIRGLNVFDVPAPDEAQPWLYAIVFLTVDIDGLEYEIVLRQTGEIETVW
ncbi:MAG: hypothetical protein D8M59_06745 [Planctomycetes bacterium]|nr:hypothetical protein [Planctomycetota bacterium]